MYMITHDQVWYRSEHDLTKDQQELYTQLTRSEKARASLEAVELEYEQRVRYHKPRNKIPTTATQLDNSAAQLNNNAKCALYKDQVRYRTIGNGWRKEPPAKLKGVFDFHIAWSCKGQDTTNAQLRTHIVAMYQHEKKVEWPEDAPIPSSLINTGQFVLGTMTSDRVSHEEDMAEMGVAIAAKVNQPGYVSLRPKKVSRTRTWQHAIPAVNQSLVGRVISYYFDDSKWYEGEVQQVSDGLTVYQPLHGEEGRGTKHKVRWVHLKFDDQGYADSELWVHLRARAKFYNPETPEPGSWKVGDVDAAVSDDSGDSMLLVGSK